MATTGKGRKPKRKRKSNVGKALAWFRDVPTLWKGIGAVATTVATILGILPWLFPSISPQPPQSEVWADLADPRAGPQMALAQYIQRPGVPAGARRDAQALGGEAGERVGVVVYFDLSAEGYEGEPIRIVWSLSDADTGEPVAGLTNQKAWPNSLIEPQSRSRRLALETWVPLPRERQAGDVPGQPRGLRRRRGGASGLRGGHRRPAGWGRVGNREFLRWVSLR